jgi:hypothetical protein
MEFGSVIYFPLNESISVISQELAAIAGTRVKFPADYRGRQCDSRPGLQYAHKLLRQVVQ